MAAQEGPDGAGREGLGGERAAQRRRGMLKNANWQGASVSAQPMHLLQALYRGNPPVGHRLGARRDLRDQS
jgi:hypothetical protein